MTANDVGSEAPFNTPSYPGALTSPGLTPALGYWPGHSVDLHIGITKNISSLEMNAGLHAVVFPAFFLVPKRVFEGLRHDNSGEGG